MAGMQHDRETNLLRNVNTLAYNKEVTELLIMQKYDFVDYVSTVLSSDNCFDTFVRVDIGWL